MGATRALPQGEHAMPAQAAVFTDERELLRAYLAHQRDGIRYAAYGLTEAQARLTPAASALSLGRLIEHVAAMERSWIDFVLQCQRQTSCTRPPRTTKRG